MNVDYDLFEDSPEKTENWAISEVKQFVDGPVVLKACMTDGGVLALLTSCETQVTLELVNVYNQEVIKSVILRKTGLTEVHNKEVRSIKIMTFFYFHTILYKAYCLYKMG